MEYSYKVNIKKKLIYMLVFMLLVGSFYAISLEGKNKSSAALEKYDIENEVKLEKDFIINFFDFERKRLARKDSLNSFVLVINVIITFFILFWFLFLKNKIIINDEGIFLFNLFGKKPSQKYRWDNIKKIEKGYPLGLSSLFLEEGLILENERGIKYNLPINWFEKKDEIFDKIIEIKYVEDISIREDFKNRNTSITKTFKDSFNEVKNNLGTYMLFSGIIFINYSSRKLHLNL